mgnify:CR=1 FL=1
MDERLGLNYIECEETPEGQVREFQRVCAGAGELNDTPRRARTIRNDPAVTAQGAALEPAYSRAKDAAADAAASAPWADP